MILFIFFRNVILFVEWVVVCLKYSSYIKYCFQKVKLYKIGLVFKIEDYIECRLQKV